MEYLLPSSIIDAIVCSHSARIHHKQIKYVDDVKGRGVNYDVVQARVNQILKGK